MTAIMLLCSLFRLPIGFGSHISNFSLLAIFIPLIGLSFSPLTMGLLFLATFLAKYFFLFTPFVTFGVPTMFAAWCVQLYYRVQQNQNRSHVLLSDNVMLSLISVVLPAACMFVFISNQTTYAPYALYWVIPMSCFAIMMIFGKNLSLFFNVFINTLASTFVAHAVGSVMWMYAKPMTPMLWASLIPFVALERLSFALVGAALGYVLLTKQEKSLESTEVIL